MYVHTVLYIVLLAMAGTNCYIHTYIHVHVIILCWWWLRNTVKYTLCSNIRSPPKNHQNQVIAAWLPNTHTWTCQDLQTSCCHILPVCLLLVLVCFLQNPLLLLLCPLFQQLHHSLQLVAELILLRPIPEPNAGDPVLKTKYWTLFIPEPNAGDPMLKTIH